MSFVIVGTGIVYALVATWSFQGVYRLLAPLALDAATRWPSWFPDIAGFDWWFFWIAESTIPMLIAMIVWIALGIGRTWSDRLVLMASSFPYALAVGLLMRPYTIIGGLEAAGVVPLLNLAHLTGVHDPLGPRQLLWFLWSPLPGAAVALAQSLRSGTTPTWFTRLFFRHGANSKRGLTLRRS